MDEIAGALVQALAEAARQRQAQRQSPLGADRITVPGAGQPQGRLIRPTTAAQQAQRAAQMRARPAPAPAPPQPQELSDDWRLTELGPDPMGAGVPQAPAPYARHLRGLLGALGDHQRLLGALVVAEALRPPLALRRFDER